MRPNTHISEWQCVHCCKGDIASQREMAISLCNHEPIDLLLLSCAKSHKLSASRRQPRLLHVSAVDRRQTWSMDKSWRCVTLSGFLHSHIVRCRWNPISCGTHYTVPGRMTKNLTHVIMSVTWPRMLNFIKFGRMGACWQHGEMYTSHTFWFFDPAISQL